MYAGAFLLTPSSTPAMRYACRLLWVPYAESPAESRYLWGGLEISYLVICRISPPPPPISRAPLHRSLPGLRGQRNPSLTCGGGREWCRNQFSWSLRHPPNKAHWGRGQRWSPIFYFFLIWDMKGKICSMIWIVKPHNGLFLVKLHKIKLCFFFNHHFLQLLSRPSWLSGQKPLLHALRGLCPALWWSASPFVCLHFFVQEFD